MVNSHPTGCLEPEVRRAEEARLVRLWSETASGGRGRYTFDEAWLEYRRAVLYSTLSPCDMCSGAALLYKMPKIVIGENTTFRGPEEYLRSRGVELVILNAAECIKLMKDFIAAKPELWNEDIGV